MHLRSSVLILCLLLVSTYFFALDPWNDPEQAAMMDKCGQSCNDVYLPATQKCMNDNMACGVECSNIDDYAARTDCDNECNRKYEVCINTENSKYNGCMKACMRASNAPPECIDLYDIGNMGPFSDCEMNIVQGFLNTLPANWSNGIGGTGTGTSGTGSNPSHGGYSGPNTPSSPVCGNGECETNESISCPSDCIKPVCGNGVCETNESFKCPSDCATPVCGNNICEPPTENYGNCQDCVEKCNDGIDNDLDTKTDCEDTDCANAPECQPIHGQVVYADMDGYRPVKDATLFFQWDDKDGNRQKSDEFYTDNNGYFSQKNSEMFAQGAHNQAITLRTVQKNGKVEVVEPDAGVYINQLIDVNSVKSGNAQKFIIGGINGTAVSLFANMRDLAKIYAHSEEAYSFAIAKGYRMDSVTVQAFDPDPSHAGSFYLLGGGPIVIGQDDSYYDTMEAPTNREYHEYGHHIMDTLWGMPNVHDLDVNHGGISNHCSADSYMEGFAEFMALVENTYYPNVRKICAPAPDKAYPYIYCVGNGYENIESNHSATNPRDQEELAVAGILWDVYDNAQINNDGKADDDYVSVDFQTLMGYLGQKNHFLLYYDGDDSYRHINYVADLYNTLKLNGVGQTDSDHDGINDLDQIFKSHGYYYHDASTNKDYYGMLRDPVSGAYRY